MQIIKSKAELRQLYAQPKGASVEKVMDHLGPLHATWIARSRYCVLTTIGAHGTDGSPRGDDGPVVKIHDQRTLLLPDWRGNNRLDSLENILEDGRVSLMFMVAGSNTVLRVNGTAVLSQDKQLLAHFEKAGVNPITVIVISIKEVYSQCARASMRARLWSRDDSADLPSVGDLLKEASDGNLGGAEYDSEWLPRAQKSMW